MASSLGEQNGTSCGDGKSGNGGIYNVKEENLQRRLNRGEKDDLIKI